MKRLLALLLPVVLTVGWSGCAVNRGVVFRQLELPDAAGRRIRPLASATNRASVLVFLANDCPVANRAVPELLRLQAAFSPHGIAFWFVHPNADETDASVLKHGLDYELPGVPLRDPELALTRALGVRITPTAVIVSPLGKVLYRGRIDDRYAALGQARPDPTSHDLARALEAVLAGRRPDPAETRAIGCHLAGTP